MLTASLYVVILITLITMVGIWATFNFYVELKIPILRSGSNWEGQPFYLKKRYGRNYD